MLDLKTRTRIEQELQEEQGYFNSLIARCREPLIDRLSSSERKEFFKEICSSERSGLRFARPSNIGKDYAPPLGAHQRYNDNGEVENETSGGLEDNFTEPYRSSDDLYFGKVTEDDEEENYRKWRQNNESVNTSKKRKADDVQKPVEKRNKSSEKSWFSWW
jgi:hypothetical protein